MCSVSYQSPGRRMLRSLCFVSLNLPAWHVCSTRWLMFIYLTRWKRQRKWRRDENARLSEAKRHLSILISAAEMPTLAGKVGENSGDFVSFNSPNRTDKKRECCNARCRGILSSVRLPAYMRSDTIKTRIYFARFELYLY